MTMTSFLIKHCQTGISGFFSGNPDMYFYYFRIFHHGRREGEQSGQFALGPQGLGSLTK